MSFIKEPSFTTYIEFDTIIQETIAVEETIPVEEEIIAVEEEKIPVEEETIPVEEETIPVEETIALEEKVEEQTIAIEEIIALEEKVEEQIIAVEEKVEEQTIAIEEKVEEQTIAIEETIIEKIIAVEEKVEEQTIAIEETIIEKIIAVEDIDKENKSLLNLFLDIVKMNQEKSEETTIYSNKIAIQLSKETIEVIKKIIDKTPTLFDEIENAVLEVIKDNKIDINDIPKFILIVQILYERIFNQKDFLLHPSKRCEVCSNILKFIIHTLVEERNISIGNKDEFLSKLDKLIESCMSLVNFSHVLEPAKDCCILM